MRITLTNAQAFDLLTAVETSDLELSDIEQILIDAVYGSSNTKGTSMRKKPDNNKEGFKGYALEEQLHEYEYGRSHLVLHDTLGCPSLRGTNTITVWNDNINDKQEIFLHAGCI